MNGAMKIMKGSLADNSETEQPYRTKGIIFEDEYGDISGIFIKGILVDFKIITPINIVTKNSYNDKELEKMGWEKIAQKVKDLENWIMMNEILSIEWDGKERSLDF